jgi:hypothetical protein
MKNYKAIAGGILAGALAITPALAGDHPRVSSDPNGVQYSENGQVTPEMSPEQMNLQEHYNQLALDRQKLADDMNANASADQIAQDRQAIMADEQIILNILAVLNDGTVPREASRGVPETVGG